MRSFAIPAAVLLAAVLAVPAHSEDGDGSKGGKNAKHKVTQSESYLEIDPIYTAILADDRPVGMLMIGVGLDVPDPQLRAQAAHAMPVLRDAFVRNLFNFSTTAVRPWAQPDVAAIADRLQAVTDKALGRKGAKLLLAQVAMRISK